MAEQIEYRYVYTYGPIEWHPNASLSTTDQQQYAMDENSSDTIQNEEEFHESAASTTTYEYYGIDDTATNDMSVERELNNASGLEQAHRTSDKISANKLLPGYEKDSMNKQTDNEFERETLDIFQCGICQKKFCKIIKFLAHFRQHRQELDQLVNAHVCSLVKDAADTRCSDTFPSSDCDEDSNIKDETFRCASCSLAFPTLCLLHNHLDKFSENYSYYYDSASRICYPHQMRCAISKKSSISFTVKVFKNENNSATITDSGYERLENHSMPVDMSLGIVSSRVFVDGCLRRKKVPAFDSDDARNEGETLIINRLHQNTDDKKIPSSDESNIYVKKKCMKNSTSKDLNKKRKRGRPKKEKTKQTESLTSCVISDETNIDRISMATLMTTTKESEPELMTAEQNKHLESDNTDFEIPDKPLDMNDPNVSEGSGMFDNKDSADLTKHSERTSDACFPVQTEVKTKRGRPRKPDHELKHKRRSDQPSTAQQKDTSGKSLIEITKENRNERLSCINCGKLFLRYCMKNHVKACTMDRAFRCDICPAKFATKGSLIGHKKAVHFKDNPYQCEICGDRFFVPSKLAKHNLIHTGERNYVCKVCDKRFMHKEHLRRHEKLHTGIKDQICATCGKMFFSNWNLKQHELTHLGGAYRCTLCVRSFTTKRSLKKHQEVGCLQSAKLPASFQDEEKEEQFEDKTCTTLVEFKFEDGNVVPLYYDQYPVVQ